MRKRARYHGNNVILILEAKARVLRSAKFFDLNFSYIKIKIEFCMKLTQINKLKIL